jgi:hypothetical protein
MKTYSIGDELTVLLNGEIGRYAAVVTSIGDGKPQEAVDLDMDRDLDMPLDVLNANASPSRPFVKLKYDYGKHRRTLKPGEYIVYSFAEQEAKAPRSRSDLVKAGNSR